MRAILLDDYGDSERLVPADVPLPDPGPGQVLVRQSLAGVNFIDVYVRQGLYRHSETYPNAPPFTPGMEGGGVVEKAGLGAGGLEPGDRVAYCLVLGSYAEFALVPAWRLVKVPDGIPMECAVTLMLQGSTAHYLARSLFPLKEGMSCLVHAGAGGVGQLLVSIRVRLRPPRAQPLPTLVRHAAHPLRQHLHRRPVLRPVPVAKSRLRNASCSCSGWLRK